MQLQLIELYLLVCHLYDTQPVLQFQRLRRVTPQFTDQELVTIYLFAHLRGFFAMRQSYDHIRHHWHEWFPHLPSYQAFNHRLSNLARAFELLVNALLQKANTQVSLSDERVIDRLARHLGALFTFNYSRVACEIADKTFCPSKNLWYHEVKLHVQAVRRSHLLPVPERLYLTKASCHFPHGVAPDESPAWTLRFVRR